MEKKQDYPVLSEFYERLVVYDASTKKELVVVTHDNVTIASSDIEVRLKPSDI